MRVAIDVSPIIPRRTGVGEHCYQLLKHMMQVSDGTEFVGISSGLRRMEPQWLPGRIPYRHFWGPTRLLYIAWEHLHAPKIETLVGGVAIYHATNYFVAPTRSAHTVVTIHDLAFLIHPEWCSPKIVRIFSRHMRWLAERVDLVSAVSEATKRDVVTYLGIPESRIIVATGAADPALQPIPLEDARTIVARDFGIRDPYFLSVGTIEPRKNVQGIVEAFAQIAGKVPHVLVLAGAAGWNSAPVFSRIAELGIESRVVRLGFVSSAALPALYGAADAFVFPSHYEGFGLPVLEAMACGCPVVASNNSSLPEVAGSAALLVDANDPGAIADAMARSVEDGQLRERMVARGFEQVKSFSWRRSAETTLAAYRRLI